VESNKIEFIYSQMWFY